MDLMSVAFWALHQEGAGTKTQGAHAHMPQRHLHTNRTNSIHDAHGAWDTPGRRRKGKRGTQNTRGRVRAHHQNLQGKRRAQVETRARWTAPPRPPCPVRSVVRFRLSKVCTHGSMPPAVSRPRQSHVQSWWLHVPCQGHTPTKGCILVCVYQQQWLVQAGAGGAMEVVQIGFDAFHGWLRSPEKTEHLEHARMMRPQQEKAPAPAQLLRPPFTTPHR